jgi:3-oxoadipate enol-lactonase
MRLLLLAGFVALAAPSDRPAADIQSGYVDVPGGRLFYETTGHGDPVVLVHDGILHRETWAAQFPALGDSHRLIRYDRRGYGRSPRASQAYSPVDDLQAIFAKLNLTRATLVGCSAGGGLSIDFAIEHPQEVRALVLIGAVVRGLPSSDHFKSRGERLSPASQPDVARAIEYWTTKDPYYVSEQSPDARARVRELLTSNPQDLDADRFARRPTWTALSRLGEIHVPTLIVVGEHDIPDVHAHSGAIQAGISSSRRDVISGAGHLVHMEQPERFNMLLRTFLDGLR